MNTEDILLRAVEMNASDLHITVGVPCIVRVNGKLIPLNDQVLKPDDTKQIVKDVTSELQWNSLSEKR